MERTGVSAVGKPVSTRVMDETYILIANSAPEALATKYWTLQLEGKLKPRDADMDFEFGLTVCGRAKLYVDGELVIDNWTRQTRGQSFFGIGSTEARGVAALKKGKAHDVKVVFVNVRGPADGDEDEALMDTGAGVRLGGAPVIDADDEIKKAEALAKEADVAIVVVGLNADWETEGYDRTTLALPGRTDELVAKVCAANKKTVVVTQSVSSELGLKIWLINIDVVYYRALQLQCLGRSKRDPLSTPGTWGTRQAIRSRMSCSARSIHQESCL